MSSLFKHIPFDIAWIRPGDDWRGMYKVSTLGGLVWTQDVLKSIDWFLNRESFYYWNEIPRFHVQINLVNKTKNIYIQILGSVWFWEDATIVETVNYKPNVDENIWGNYLQENGFLRVVDKTYIAKIVQKFNSKELTDLFSSLP